MNNFPFDFAEDSLFRRLYEHDAGLNVNVEDDANIEYIGEPEVFHLEMDEDLVPPPPIPRGSPHAIPHDVTEEQFVRGASNNGRDQRPQEGASRSWVFVLNNYTQDEETALQADGIFRYLVYGREVGISGTPHLQGFFYLRDAKTWHTLHRRYPRMWIERAKANEKAIEYCKKDGDFFEKGEAPCSRKEASKRGGEATKEAYRVTLDLVKRGMLYDVEPQHLIQHYSALRNLARDFMQPPESLEGPCGVWYWGVAGTGKSHKARIDYPKPFLKLCNKWWDGYRQEENVLLDDFDVKHTVLAHHVKTWADKFAFSAEIKGSALMIRPKAIVFTSNYHPLEVWSDPHEYDAIRRRLHIVHFVKPNDDSQELFDCDERFVSVAPSVLPVNVTTVAHSVASVVT